MSSIRIYQPITLNPGETITVLDESLHYLKSVLRVKINDTLIIFNGQGGEYSGTITEINKKSIHVLIKEFQPKDTESPLELYLAQGISRGEKMDFTIQKAVELGVKKIIPLFTERTTLKLDQERREKRFSHWYSIIVHACQQSHRNRIPELLPLMEYEQGLDAIPADAKLLLHPDSSSPLKKIPLRPNQRILLLIGPEGGLSNKEVDIAIEKGFKPVAFGPRILRTETASVAAITALQCLMGDLG